MKLKRFISFMTAIIILAMLMSSSVPSLVNAEVIKTTVLNGINAERKLNYLIAYTDEYGSKTTGTDDKGIEAVVNSKGIVTAIGGNNNDIPKGGFVLSGSSTKKTLIEKNIKVGYAIYLDKEALSVTIIADDYNPFYSSTIEYSAINSIRSENTLIIYNGKDGKKSSLTNEWGFEVVVDKDGYIISVGGNNNTIPEDGLVLSAVGTKKAVFMEMAKIGLSVDIDTADKIITLSYSKDNAIQASRLILEGWKDAFAAAKAAYKNINHSAIENSLTKLESELGNIETGIADDDMLVYTVAQNRFDAISNTIKSLLIEYPAVEGRALWIRPTQKNDAEVKKVIEEIYNLGFNIVCIEGLYNNTMIMPQPEFSHFSHSPYFGGYDVLKAYIEECHKYGMELHLWMPVYRVGHDASTYPSLGLGNVKREWRNITNTGVDYAANAYGNGHFLNPALPEVSEYLLSVYKYILENYSIDGFQLDYIRYPDRVDGVDFGYDDYTLGLFEEEYGYNPKDITTTHSLWNTWCQFRAKFVTDFVLDVKALVEDIRPDVYLSADVAPSFNESLTRMMQDTVKWISEAYISIVYPMAYGTVDRVSTWSNTTVQLAGDNVFTYIGVGNYGADTFFEQMVAIRNNGADGVAFFAYAEFTSGEYDIIPETMFSKRAASPTYNGKKALIAQLKYTKERIISIIEPSGISGSAELSALCADIDALIARLDDSNITECKSDIIKLVDDFKAVLSGKVTDEKAVSAVSGDLRIISKITALSKDDEKAAYYIDNPLPDMYDLSDDEDNNTADNSETDDDGIALTTFEKIIRGISMGIVSFSILGLPLYFYLDYRKKKIIAASKDKDKQDENDDIGE
ncbi:MAG: hypothetical protein CVU97_00805 [Firmicutes bacterium HGW-Firmicutes-21]|nr:MAG: hypothetical protein CVU97_00805 [Firmicutes bacterium HGW-Firmicutes-21]